MRTRIGRVIFAFLLASQLATIIGLVMLSRHQANVLVDERSAAVLREDANDAAFRLESHLQPAESLLTLTVNVLAEDVVEPELLEEAFRQSLLETPQIAGSFVGDESGNFFYVSRTTEGIRVKQIFNGDQRVVTVATYDEQGSQIREENLPDDPYDPRQRLWYGLATGSLGTVGWTEPYVFFTSQQPGITAAKAIVRDGEAQGVVGVDVELGSLSEFLSALRPSENGEAAIVDRQTGLVIASSRAHALNGDAPAPVRSELDDVVDDLLESGPGAEDLEFTNDTGETVRVAVREVAVGERDWTIVMMGTEEEVVGGLASSTERNRILQLIAGAVALVATALVAAPILRPVRKLEFEAQTDVLTELPNRRSIMDAARRLSLSSSPHAFAMIDVDTFKSINDRYGHQVGDEVLCEIAARLAASLEMGDHIGRIGGEEFVALLRGDREQTTQTASHMLQAVRETPVETSVGPVPATVSIGLAEASESSDEVRLLAKADAAMLGAKSSGRNRLSVFDAAEPGVQTPDAA